MGLVEKVRDSLPARKSSTYVEPPFWDIEQLRYGLFGTSSYDSERERIENDFLGYAAGIYKRNGPVFALMVVRMMVFSEARFRFRREADSGPGELFNAPELGLLKRPWPNGTTGDLLARMIQDADLAGNAYVTTVNGHLRRLRPDRVTILTGSKLEPELYGAALDAEILGYFYEPQGQGAANVTLLLPEQVAHFAPLPDPEANWRGMSWLTPVLREIVADTAATTHKLKFFENGASPQVIVSYDAAVTPERFKVYAAAMKEMHTGADNAYKTLHLGAGADAKVVGSDLRQLDFKATQGAGETRLAAAARVPAVIAGFSEGLSGSSLNEGNFKAARRLFIDGTMRPLWRNAAGSLATLITVPADAELWWDERDIAFLREDRRDQAEIQGLESRTIRTLLDAGYTAASVQAAVLGADWSLLEHTGLFSVQLQKPGGPAAINPPVSDPTAGGQ